MAFRASALISPADEQSSTISDRYLVSMLARFLAPYTWQLAVVFVLLLAVTLVSLAPPYLIQRAVDGPITQARPLDELLPYGVLYFVAIIGTFILRFSYTYMLQTVGQNALLDLRQTLFEHILRQDMRFFNQTPVGQIVSRLSNDIEALTELLSTSIVMVLSNTLTLIGIIVVMFALNWKMAIVGLITLPLMVALTIYFRKHIRDASNRYHRVVADFLAFINEQLGGMLVIQLFGRQSVSREEFDYHNNRYRDLHMLMRDQYTVYASTLSLLTAIGLAIVLYGGGAGVLAGWATLGILIAFIQYTQRSFEPILQLSEQFAQIQQALSAGERIARMLNVEPTIVDPPTPRTIATFRGAITFDQMSFSYEPATPVLQQIDLTIPAGQSVAVVGPTGAGKTSLVGLLARFYDVQAGRLLIDGVDIRDLALADLRRMVTVVPQNPYCFNGTIADNLRLFTPDISREKMIAAAQVACAAPFIERLPGAYDYTLLPGGENLSQGQRQLLALARALLHNPHGILVLDEATSSIDTETEALIQQGLHQVLKNRTSIIIAHRLSTVREVDRILVLQRGKMIEDGTHQQLLNKGGLYAHLYQRQFLEPESSSEPS